MTKAFKTFMWKDPEAEAYYTKAGKLKLRCGAQFTSKLEGMVTDMKLSTDMQTAFLEHEIIQTFKRRPMPRAAFSTAAARASSITK